MDLKIIRDVLDSRSTEGDFIVNDAFECYTLELPVKDGMPGSAIAPGAYDLTLEPSPKFMASSDPWVQKYAKLIPHINGIAYRSHILVHWGDFPENTDGCVLVGRKRGRDFLAESRLAFEALHAKLLSVWMAKELMRLQVIGGIPIVASTPILGNETIDL
jgi:Steigviridae/Suoliviridae L,D-carboxypeptidase/transpeptidase